MRVCAQTVRYVDGNHAGAGDVSGVGQLDRPYASLAYALSDVPMDTLVYVAPGHSENVTQTWAWGAAGVYVRGLGWGGRRPTFTFTANVRAMIDQPSCVLDNLLFLNAYDGNASLVQASTDAPDCTLRNLEIRDEGSVEAISYVVLLGDRPIVDGISIIGYAGGSSCQCGIKGNTPANGVIRNFYIEGNFSGAAIWNNPGPWFDFNIFGGDGSIIWNKHSNDIAIDYDHQSSAKGTIMGPIGIRLADDAANVTECIPAAEAVPARYMHIFQKAIQVVNANGEAGMTWNGTASTDDA
jgi:hypothetical protein